MTELSRACERYGSEIQAKVQKYDAIHSITITKGARSSEGSLDERPVDKQALGTVFVGNLPQRWTKATVREWLTSSIELQASEIAAVEFCGQYKEGKQLMVECKSSSAASDLVSRVRAIADNQKKNREPLVYEARKLNLTAAEREAASAAKYVVRIL